MGEDDDIEVGRRNFTNMDLGTVGMIWVTMCYYLNVYSVSEGEVNYELNSISCQFLLDRFLNNNGGIDT